MMTLDPYSPNAVKKRKDISDGVMESWSVESSVWSPNHITPVFQYSLTPTFGSGYAGLGFSVHHIIGFVELTQYRFPSGYTDDV